MYTERTNYYAKPGRRADVLRIRRQASRVRVDLGLQAGTISQKVEADSEGPDVQWECHFLTAEEHKADLAARAASADFEAVRAEMQTVIDRFERHVLERDRSAETADWAEYLEKAKEHYAVCAGDANPGRTHSQKRH